MMQIKVVACPRNHRQLAPRNLRSGELSFAAARLITDRRDRDEITVNFGRMTIVAGREHDTVDHAADDLGGRPPVDRGLERLFQPRHLPGINFGQNRQGWHRFTWATILQMPVRGQLLASHTASTHVRYAY